MKRLLEITTVLTAAAIFTPAFAAADGKRADRPLASLDSANSAFGVFNDPALSSLVERALLNNHELATAAARVQQARALAGAARSEYFPQIAVDAWGGRQKSLDTGYRTSDYASLPGVASWELDLWGRVRKGTAAARYEAGAAEAAFSAARLSIAAEVTQTYYSLRAAQLEEETIVRSIQARREGLRIVGDRTEVGTSSALDLARAETELAVAEAERTDAAERVSQLTNALAALVADDDARLKIDAVTYVSGAALPVAPSVPEGLSSTVLLRRPDVAAAQLAADAASARIGVARAAFFPTISLTGSAGWESTDLSSVVSGGTETWSFGPRVYLPLFMGGRNRANLARAEAAFAEESARYRQSLQLALQEVRDALAATRFVAERTAAVERAVASSRRAAELSRTRYDAGSVSYLEVVDSERSALDNERALARLRGQRLVATAALIRALGGSWSSGNFQASL